MDEVVPVILGAVLGAIIWRTTRGGRRTTLSVLAVAVCGAFATVLSGEYHASWLYLLLDLGGAALGLAIGFALAHWLLPSHGSARTSAAER